VVVLCLILRDHVLYMEAIVVSSQGSFVRLRRLLLDGGSQLSYVTKSLQECLGLKAIRREKLRVNTFGSSAFVANPCDII